MRTILRTAAVAIVLMWSSAGAGTMEPPPDNPDLAGNCGIARPDETGCNVSVCEACVCASDPFCCGEVVMMGDSTALIDGDFCSDGPCWDPICVGEAGGQCATACDESSALYAPTLSPWGLGLAALLLAGIAYQTLRRSRPSRV